MTGIWARPSFARMMAAGRIGDAAREASAPDRRVDPLPRALGVEVAHHRSGERRCRDPGGMLRDVAGPVKRVRGRVRGARPRACTNEARPLGNGGYGDASGRGQACDAAPQQDHGLRRLRVTRDPGPFICDRIGADAEYDRATPHLLPTPRPRATTGDRVNEPFPAKSAHRPTFPEGSNLFPCSIEWSIALRFSRSRCCRPKYDGMRPDGGRSTARSAYARGSGC